MRIRNSVRIPALVAFVVVMGSAVNLSTAESVLAVNSTDPTIVAGSVTRDGAADVSATVDARLWPNNDVLSALPDGATVPMYNIVSGLGVTGTGQFDVNLVAANVPADYTTGGQVNLEVIVHSNGEQASWDVSARMPVSGSEVYHWSAAAGYSETPTFAFEMGSVPTVTETYAEPLSTTSLDEAGNPIGGSDAQPLTKVSEPTESMVYCFITAGAWYYGRPEHWVNVNSWSGAPVTVDEDAGSFHTLGVAYSANGTNWSQNGSTGLTVSTGSGASIGGIYDRTMYNRVNYRQFYSCGGSQYRRPINFYDIIATDLTYHIYPHTYYTYANSCVSKSKGYTGYKSTGTNYTYSYGVSLGPISVSAQSGFNSSTKLTYHVQAASWLCGSTALGWPYSPNVEAHSR